MQLTLTVVDRIRITDLFPAEDSMQTRGITRDIMDKTEIGQEEAKAIGMQATRMPDGKMGWRMDEKKAKDKKVIFTRVEAKFLKERVKEMDEKKKIKDEHYDVCLKIQEGKLNDKKERKQKGK